MSDFMGVTLDFDALNQLRNTLGTSDAVFARALKSGISSGGFHLKNALQKAMKENAFGWPERRKYPNPSLTFRGATLLDKEMTSWMHSMQPGATSARATLQPDRPLGGKLVRILRYKYHKENLSAEIGILEEFTGRKTVNLMRMFQQGRSYGDADSVGGTGGRFTAITPPMRKYMAAIGMPLAKSTMQIQRPPRPLFGPVYQREHAATMALITLIIREKLTNGFTHT